MSTVEIFTDVAIAVYKHHFVGKEVINGDEHNDFMICYHDCELPHVDRTEYVVDVSADGFLCLVNGNGNTMDDLSIAGDPAFLTKFVNGLAEGENMLVIVVTLMGEERCAFDTIFFPNVLTIYILPLLIQISGYATMHNKVGSICVVACNMSNSPLIYMCRCMHATRETR